MHDTIVKGEALPESPTAAMRRAFRAAGGQAALAKELGISPAAVNQWHFVPVSRVLDVERIVGIPRHELRPDIYPQEIRPAEPVWRTRVRTALEASGLTASEASRRAGQNRSFVGDALHRSSPTIDNLVALASVLGVSIAYLCGEDDGVDHARRAGTSLTGPDLIALQDDRFQAYVAARHRLGADPNLQNAIALADAYRAFADVMGLDRV